MSGKKNISRYRKIISVFARHGFGFLLDQVGILDYLKIKKRIPVTGEETENPRHSTGARLRMSFEELGPTFVKLGQILSTRVDVFPVEIIEELTKLQDSVQPFQFHEVRAIIEREFGDDISNIFKEFEEIPVASASLSQVHRARINSGKQVAVKVQRPGIFKSINQDLSILKDLAHFIDTHSKYGEIYDFSSMVIDFENTLKSELDFTQEGENVDTFRRNLLGDKGVEVPEIKWIYTTSRVLTMEYVEGYRVDDHEALDLAGIDKRILAERLSRAICNQIFRDGFFHADPHPGNIQILQNGTIVFLDHGMVGRLNEKQKEIISNFFLGVTTQNSRTAAKAVVDLGPMPKKRDLRKFEKDVDRIIDKYLTLSWRKLKIGELFYDVFSTAFANHIKIPREFTLIARSVTVLQSILEKLDPDLNALELLKPEVKKMLYHSFSAKKISRDIQRSLFDYRDLIKEIPAVVSNLLDKIEDDEITIQFEIKDIDKIQKRFDRVFNRISFSVVLLAVSIIISGIIIGSGLGASVGSETALLNLLLLKIGLGVAGVIVLGLLISLHRTGY